MRRLARALRGALPVALAALALSCSAGGPVTAAGPAGRPAPGPVVDLTVDPAMAKGPADAPVTIVEFSDYQ